MADPLDRKARRARLRLVGLGVLVGAAVVGGAVAAVSLAGGDESDGPTASASASAASPSSTDRMTPGKAKPVKLAEPKGQKDGASVGFPKDALGSVSAAVYHLEEFAFLDDIQARRQLEVRTSKDSPDYIDEQVSEVRKLRESVGLPPSGGSPLTVTTTVNAVRGRSVTEDRDVVQVWMNYDRYATSPDGTPDKNPLKGETSDVFLKWEDGDWKITNEERYTEQGTFPVAYFPDSPVALQDGWRQVTRAE